MYREDIDVELSSTTINIEVERNSNLNKLEDDLNELSSINLNSPNFAPKIENP